MGPIDNRIPAVWIRHESQLIANYSIGTNLLRAGKSSSERVGVSMSTMTHPDYRGQGYFPRLANCLYDAIQSDGINTVIGFPNHLSVRTFVDRLDWSLTSEIPTLTLDLNDWVHKVRSPSVGADWIHDCVPKKLAKPQWLEEMVHLDRTVESLKWRYQDSPVHRYKFVYDPNASEVMSYAVFKWYKSSVDIVELVPQKSEDVTVLISIVADAVQGVASHLNTWMMPHLRFRSDLQRLGFIPSNSTSYFGLRASGISWDRTRYLRPDQWFLQMGDSDVF